MGLMALRVCANPLLNSPGMISVTTSLLTTLSGLLVASARHSYRLVRRELLLLIASLDWVQLEFLEHSRVRRSVCLSVVLSSRQTFLFLTYLLDSISSCC
ncbi:unnamed protein product [Dibothriocephalus latus]|uniref:Uncharacterized protein n=1 Tax=Dibothriocephalus latus TaxID=60516 RepID=A0A3P6Q3D2_DIBLA|nr:unnamed protein product [Dibothriocephalus latus]